MKLEHDRDRSCHFLRVKPDKIFSTERLEGTCLALTKNAALMITDQTGKIDICSGFCHDCDATIHCPSDILQDLANSVYRSSAQCLSQEPVKLPVLVLGPMHAHKDIRCGNCSSKFCFESAKRSKMLTQWQVILFLGFHFLDPSPVARFFVHKSKICLWQSY